MNKAIHFFFPKTPFFPNTQRTHKTVRMMMTMKTNTSDGGGGGNSGGGAVFAPPISGAGFASTRVPVVPSKSVRLIADFVANWNQITGDSAVNAITNNKRQKMTISASTTNIGKGNNNDKGTFSRGGQNAMVKVIDGESVLVHEGKRGTDEVNVGVILKELPGHALALLMAGDEREAMQWKEKAIDAANSKAGKRGDDDEEVSFGEYLMNSLDLLRRVVSLRSMRSVKHYFERIGYDPTPAVLDCVSCALRRVATMDEAYFLGRKSSDGGANLELKCGIVKTCADIVTEMWEQDMAKCAAELATYPVPLTTAQKENNTNGTELQHEENMLMAFYDAAYAMTREVHEIVESDAWNGQTEEFRAFLDTFASFAFNTEIVEYAHQSGGKVETMRMVRLALALLQFAPKETSNLGDTELWTRLWYAAKGAQCLRTICTADIDNGNGETLYDKYLHDAAVETSNESEKASSVVARDCLKLATECAALAFVQALDEVYPKYNAPAFFGSFGMHGNGDPKRWRIFATLARCCEVLCEDSEVRDAVISVLIVPLVKFMSNVVRGRSGDGSKKIAEKPQGTFFVIFEEVRIRGGTQKATETVKLAWMFIYGTIASAQAAPFMKSKSFGKEFSRLLNDTSSENPDIYGGPFTAERVKELLSELHESAKSLVGDENSKLFETFLSELR